MNRAEQILTELQNAADPKLAQHHQKFFKTGKGEYAEGDKFYGLTSPIIKSIVKKYYKTTNFQELTQLIQHPYHEARSTALSILVEQYAKASPELQDEIVKFYLENLPFINNWDLVDISAHKIIGAWCCRNNDYQLLFELADSGSLWAERVSIVANAYIIRHGNHKIIEQISRLFLNHPHDLIHKAVGWMLRELGKQDENALCRFLDAHAAQMPRTALRYSLERLSPEQRRHYMQQK